MEQLKQRKWGKRALHALTLLVIVAVLSVFSSDAIRGRWAFYQPKTITVNGTAVAVDDDLELNEYEAEDFALTNGRMELLNEGYRTGIDVSSHQGEIDWEQVAGDGISFAMIRVGFRGYGEGGIHQDERFLENAEGALNNGLDIGVYFFSQATGEKEAVEEADFLLQKIDGLDITFPVVFDWELIAPEEAGEAGARTDTVDEETATACAAAFCQRIEEAGYQPAVYCNRYNGYFAYDVPQIQEYLVWYSVYDRSWPDYYYRWDMWQYSNRGTVAGIAGPVDLNLYPIQTDPADSTPEGAGSAASSTGSQS